MPKLNKFCIDDLQSVSILDIAEELGLSVNRHRKCLCPFHPDKAPSLKLWPGVNGWKCYGCGEKGTGIDLVMKKEGLGFHEACEWIARKFDIMLRYDDDRPAQPVRSGIVRHRPLTTVNTHHDMFTLNPNLISQCTATNTSFCRSLVSAGILTEAQMQHAATVYRLGGTKDDGVIFWQIDPSGQVRDGKVMFYHDDCHRDHSRPPSWVSFRLKKQGALAPDWKAAFCLFGLHLLPATPSASNADRPVIAIVESEKTAVICSALLPSINGRPVIWMATGGLDALTVESLRPLVGRDVTIFPDTDTTGQAFRKWHDTVSAASKELSHRFFISDVLERHASATQKQRKIDIADLLIESRTQQ